MNDATCFGLDFWLFRIGIPLSRFDLVPRHSPTSPAEGRDLGSLVFRCDAKPQSLKPRSRPAAGEMAKPERGLIRKRHKSLTCKRWSRRSHGSPLQRSLILGPYTRLWPRIRQPRYVNRDAPNSTVSPTLIGTWP